MIFSDLFVRDADFEFLVAEGEILNSRRFKAMNVWIVIQLNIINI